MEAGGSLATSDHGQYIHKRGEEYIHRRECTCSPQNTAETAAHKWRWWGKGSSMQYKWAHQMKLLWPTLAALHPPLSTTQDPHSKVTPATVTRSRHLHTTAASQCTSITRQVEHTPQWLPVTTDNLVLY